jgi:hypothetical protein
LRPLLHKWEANYFNGHEHDLEHIVEEGSKVNYVCTGAGKFCCYADKNLDTVPQGSIQFAMSGAGGTDWWGRAPWSPPEFDLLAGFVRASPAHLPTCLSVRPSGLSSGCRAECWLLAVAVGCAASDFLPHRRRFDACILPRAQRDAAVHHPAYPAAHQDTAAPGATSWAALLKHDLPGELDSRRNASSAACRKVPAVSADAARPNAVRDGMGLPSQRGANGADRGQAQAG